MFTRRQVLAAVLAAPAAAKAVMPSQQRARFSCLDGDPGYDSYVEFGGHSRDWRVFVDGNQMHEVVDADLGADRCTVNVTDEGGHVVLIGGDIARRKVYGRVSVEVRDRETGVLHHRFE